MGVELALAGDEGCGESGGVGVALGCGEDGMEWVRCSGIGSAEDVQ